jgi:putative sigma-54 modulation protein
MRLKITGRHMDITPALRQYVESRFGRLDRYGLKLGSVQVVLGVEKLQHKAEVVCEVNGKRVQAKTATPEMYATIDALVGRLDTQLRKWKDRLVSHKPNTRGRTKVRALESMLQDQPSRAVVERRAVPILSVDEAQEAFADSPSPFMVFMNAETGTIQLVERRTGGLVAVIEPYPAGDAKRVIPSGVSV